MNELAPFLSLWNLIFYSGVFVFVILDVALAGIIVYAFLQGLQYRPPFGMKAPVAKARKITIAQEELVERWGKIADKANRETVETVRIAIIEADAFVDFILKELGVPGEHFSDRLNNVNPDNIRSIGNLWRAHRVRNSLVHTPGYSISLPEAKTLFRFYEEFLKEIQVLP